LFDDERTTNQDFNIAVRLIKLLDMSDESIINFHLNKRFKAKNYTNEK
jgi:hypothetical protein